MIHTKALAVDDDFVSLGSYNLDHRSLAYNLEVVVNVLDVGYTAAVKKMLEDDMGANTELTLATYRAAVAGWSGCWSGSPTACGAGCKRRRRPSQPRFVCLDAAPRSALLWPAWASPPASLAALPASPAPGPPAWPPRPSRRPRPAPPPSPWSLRIQIADDVAVGIGEQRDLPAARERQLGDQHPAARRLDLGQRGRQVLDDDVRPAGPAPGSPRRAPSRRWGPPRRRASCRSTTRSAPCARRRPWRKKPRHARSRSFEIPGGRSGQQPWAH